MTNNLSSQNKALLKGANVENLDTLCTLYRQEQKNKMRPSLLRKSLGRADGRILIL